MKLGERYKIIQYKIYENKINILRIFNKNKPKEA